MSLPTCPKPGACLDLEARMEACELADRRHEEGMQRIGAGCDAIKADVHRMMIESGLRNSAADGLKKWFAGCILVGLLQFGATVWWASRLDTTVAAVRETVLDHEARLRVEERNH